MRKSSILTMVLAIGAFASLAVIPCRAAVPTQIKVQGRLTTSGGAPVPAGTKTFTFRIFDSQSGGTQVWPVGLGESQGVSTASDGLWTAQVGLVNPLSDTVFASAQRWLEITVSDGTNPPETLSRMKINANAYAFRIGTVDGAEGGHILSKVRIGTGGSNAGAEAFAVGSGSIVAGNYSSATGGTGHQVYGDHSIVGGGDQNWLNGSTGVIGGGSSNSITSGYGNTIGGGVSNEVEGGDKNVVAGGESNRSALPAAAPSAAGRTTAFAPNTQ